MNEAIKKMLQEPGIYAVGSSANTSIYFLVEVEANGTAHQLTPLGKRDGILSPNRWKEDAVVLQRRVRHGNQA